MLATQKVVIDEEAFKIDLTFIKAMIHYEIDLALFGVEEARRNLIQQDPQARFAHQPVRRSAAPHGARAGRLRAEGDGKSNRAFGPYILGRSLILPLGIGAC